MCMEQGPTSKNAVEHSSKTRLPLDKMDKSTIQLTRQCMELAEAQRKISTAKADPPD